MTRRTLESIRSLGSIVEIKKLPMIILVFGLPGSGKSYFASRLAKSIKAQYANSDKIRKELFTDRKYTIDEKAKVYNVMIERMRMAIRQNETIVLDATFFKKDIRKNFWKISQASEVKMICIEIQAEQAVIEERLKKKRQYSEADFDVYLQVEKAFEPMDSEHLVLQSTQDNLTEMIDAARLYLAKYE